MPENRLDIDLDFTFTDESGEVTTGRARAAGTEVTVSLDGLDVRNDFQNRSAWFITKNQRDILKRCGMSFPHSSGADESNVYVFQG